MILSHGRPDRVHSYDSLMASGYTGKVYIVIDDEDKTSDEYRRRFGDKVLEFCKAEYATTTDEGDNFQHRKAIVYARNACWDLAEQMGCRYFCQFDDDYVSFHVRHDSELKYVSGTVTETIDEVIDSLLQFYISIPASSLALAQGGDHLGGGGKVLASGRISGGMPVPKLARKCMNSWFCDTQKPFRFFGHMNEDVSAYVTHGRRGQLFLTAVQAMLVQKPTQSAEGGMSDVYLESGTYVKSFYTVMAAPSCVQVGVWGDPRGKNYRLHHKINWQTAVPKLMREEWKKQT